MLLNNHCINIRRNVLRLSYKYHWGHIGSALSCVDILMVLYFKVMKKTDRFILSKGHAAMTLYSILLEKGQLTKKEIAKLGEHPDKNEKLGIWCSTGSLGHGLPIGLGMALAGRKTFVLLSDGEFDEGSNWEAIKIASGHKIDITAIIDFNDLQAYRKLPYGAQILAKRLKSFGWKAQIIDGHNYSAIIKALKFKHKNTPYAIIAKTIKGKGIAFLENQLESHYLKLNHNSLKEALNFLTS